MPEHFTQHRNSKLVRRGRGGGQWAQALTALADPERRLSITHMNPKCIPPSIREGIQVLLLAPSDQVVFEMRCRSAQVTPARLAEEIISSWASEQRAGERIGRCHCCECRVEREQQALTLRTTTKGDGLYGEEMWREVEG